MLWPHETRAASDGCLKKKMPMMKNVTMGLSRKKCAYFTVQWGSSQRWMIILPSSSIKHPQWSKICANPLLNYGFWWVFNNSRGRVIYIYCSMSWRFSGLSRCRLKLVLWCNFCSWRVPIACIAQKEELLLINSPWRRAGMGLELSHTMTHWFFSPNFQSLHFRRTSSLYDQGDGGTLPRRLHPGWPVDMIHAV